MAATAGLVLVAACVLMVASPATAVTWKLVTSVSANLQPWFGYPPSDPGCTAPGVCEPYNTTLPPGTLWYWCGWSTKERSMYWVTSTGAPVSTFMMRESDVEECLLSNVSLAKNCQNTILSDTLCDTLTSCSKRAVGMSFVDPSCLLVANNDKNPAPVTIQLWQFYDSRRYYGTVFSIILFILLGGFALGHMGFTCYHQIRKPNHRLDELEKLTRAKIAAQAAAAGNSFAGDASEASGPDDGTATGSRRSTTPPPGRGGGLIDSVKRVLTGNTKGAHAH